MIRLGYLECRLRMSGYARNNIGLVEVSGEREFSERVTTEQRCFEVLWRERVGEWG